MINLLKKICSFIKINDKNKYKYAGIKISLIYLIIGCVWIYFSDRMANKLASDNGMLVAMNTYKGWLYVIITSTIIYLLIRNLIKKVDLTEKELNESYEELSASNEELQAYVEQLTASDEELRAQYDQINENEKKLRISEEKNSAIIKALPDLLFVIDNKGYFIDCKANDEVGLLIPKEAFIGKTLWDVLPEEISKIAFEKIKLVLTKETLESFEYNLKINNNEQYYELRMVKNNENKVLAISRNITIERKSEFELKLSEEKYKALVNQMHQGLALYEAVVNEEKEIIDYKFLDANESHEKIVGTKNKDVLGKSIHQVIYDIGNENIEKLENVVKTGEPVFYERHSLKTGKYYEVNAYRPKELQLAVILTDITKRKQVEHERKQLEQKLEYLSYHDELTGLYNRRFFEEEEKRLDVERNYPLTIFMADVNGLKLVNDSFGHSIGDELLKKVAEVLTKGCRADDIIARLGGDEFVVLMPKTDAFAAKQISKRIKAIALQEKLGSIDISISVGFETKNKKEEQIKEIFKKAEDHMYKKKLFESPSMRGKTINTIISTLHEKNKREEQHSHRVSILCQSIGQTIGLSEEEIQELKTVGLLHDIGKIAIDENILNKPGKLTVDEWEEIKRHPEIGYRILSTVNNMSEMAEFVLAHHERLDGKGYPKGLDKEQIPLQSRIIAIADAYDAMTSERSYGSAIPKELAIQELQKNAGTQFDSELVKVFIERVLDKSMENKFN